MRAGWSSTAETTDGNRSITEVKFPRVGIVLYWMDSGRSGFEC